MFLLIRSGRDAKSVSKSESASDMSKQFYRGTKYNQVDYMRDSCGRSKSKIITGHNPSSRDTLHTKKVWEPMESQRKYPRSNSDSDVTLSSSTFKVEVMEPDNIVTSSGTECSGEATGNSCEIDHEFDSLKDSKETSSGMGKGFQNGFHVEMKDPYYTVEAADEEVESSSGKNSSFNGTSDAIMSSTSNSDNCSSCLSEGSSNTPNLESSSTSDSEDASQQSEGRETSVCVQNGFPECHEVGLEKKHVTDRGEAFRSRISSGFPPDSTGTKLPGPTPTKTAQNPDNGKTTIGMGSQHQGMLPPMHNHNMHFPMFQAPSTMGYYHQNAVTWPPAPANGLMPFPHPSHYLLASPLGYGLNGNSRYCMQYGALPHLTTPMLNPGQVPVYHPVAKANGMKSVEPAKISKTGGTQEVISEANKERVVPAGVRSNRSTT
ncbi:hypothetical protein L1049_008780 [Liquidambar formosana]|uniref:Uncharacterized protein n=1 Tax=Liquidambar formosana TaxID=63359 RepID=A0AAP0S791_LIQFO